MQAVCCQLGSASATAWRPHGFTLQGERLQLPSLPGMQSSGTPVQDCRSGLQAVDSLGLCASLTVVHACVLAMPVLGACRAQHAYSRHQQHACDGCCGQRQLPLAGSRKGDIVIYELVH